MCVRVHFYCCAFIILHPRVIVCVKEYFQVESTDTLLMVTSDVLSISALCSSEPDLEMVGFI